MVGVGAFLTLAGGACHWAGKDQSALERDAAPVEFRMGPEAATEESDRMIGIPVDVIIREVQPVYDSSQLPRDMTPPDPPDPYRMGPPPYPKGVGSPPSDRPGPIDGVERSEPPADAAPNPEALKNAPTLSFDSLTFDDNQTFAGSLFIPPDTHTAAGPNHVVNVVNVLVRMHDKLTGATVFTSSLRNFFTAPGFTAPVNATFDPKVLYDEYNQRWLIVTLEKTASDSALFLGVSATSDPTGSWFLARIPAVQTIGGVNCWFDYPGFAVGTDAVYLTGNYFRLDDNNYCSSRLFIVSKSFYSGAPVSVSVVNPYASATATTHMPAQMHGTPPAGVGTFLVGFSGIASGGNSAAQVIRVDNPLGTPVFTSQLVGFGQALVNVTATAPQSGTATGIAVNDRRALSAIWRNNSLYFAFSSRPPSGAPDAAENAAWWVRADTSNLASLTRADIGYVGADQITPNAHTFFGALAVNPLGDMAIGFTVTGAGIFPSSGYTWRAASDAPGTTRAPQVLRAGTDFYIRTFSSTANRWGDYSGAAVDPVDGCFWISNQHAITRGTITNGNQDGRWAVATARFCGSSGGPATNTLSVTRTGTGSGTVTSNPAGIDCGATCSASFAASATVELSPSAAPGSSFAGWSGDCTGLGACSVSMDQARNVTATFTSTGGISEGFDIVSGGCVSGWTCVNNSTTIGSASWFQGNATTFPAQAGASNAYIAVNFNSTTSTNTISNWLISPEVNFNSGAQLRFYTRTVNTPQFPDRLEVRISSAGSSTNVGSGPAAVGDFTTLLLTVNPSLLAGAGSCPPGSGAYPNAWCELVLGNGQGIPNSGSGRIAFRYFVTSGGPTGSNSDYIGIDTFSYTPGSGTSQTLNVTRSGSGSGTVSSSPPGIDCGSSCSASFPDSTSVNLSALPDGSSTFAGWSGDCTGMGACSVLMDQTRNVDANFATANTPPGVAYSPVPGTTILYSGAGTASPIVATPSGGSGSGAAATTTVGACTISGGGAAFPTTSIGEISFVGSTTTPQNLNLPNCVRQAAQVDATLSCPESQGGGASVNRAWTLRCPALPAGNPVISVGSASGNPGGGTTPVQVPVTFTRDPSAPVADFGVRVSYPPAVLSAVAAGANGGDCLVNQASGFVNVLGPPGQTDVPTGVYCNITFTIAGGAPSPSTQDLILSFPPGFGCVNSDTLPVNCSLQNGAISVLAAVPPNIAYSPTTGSTISYSGAGSAGPIVATPSGGTGSGPAATTTVGACTISGGGAAFPTTSIGQISFVGSTTTAQNLNLPSCVPQPTLVDATLTCPESQGGGAPVNRVWTLRCPVAVVGPNIGYNPVAGATTGSGGPVNFTGVTSVGSTGNGQIVATPAGGSGGGTTTVNACAFSGGDAASFSGAGAVNLTFTAGNATPQNIALACTAGATPRTTNLQCTETIAGGATAQRFWVLNCPAGVDPPNIAYNPATGSTITYSGAGSASPIVATPSGGNGSGAAATTTVGACTISGGGSAFPTTNIGQISFVGSTTTPQNLNLPSCVPQPTQVDATLTCPESQGGGAPVNRVWTLRCPVAVVGPNIGYNPAAGATSGSGGPVNFTGVGSVGSSGSGQIVATPSGGSGSGTTTVNACAFSGGDAASFSGAAAVNLSFTAGNNTPQNIALGCTAGATPRTTNLQCTETIGGGAATQRFWVLNCPLGTAAPQLAFDPQPDTTISYTIVGTVDPIVVTPSAGSGTGAPATTTLGPCTISGGGVAFPTTSVAQISFVGDTIVAQDLVLPNCQPQEDAPVLATLSCPETRGGDAPVERQWALNCPGGPIIFADGFED